MTIENRLEKWSPQVLSILRIVAGFLFLQHGLQKWFGFPVANPAFANLQFWSLLGVAGCIEIIGGTLVTLGLFTRYAALVMSGEMAFAYFWAHAPRAFSPMVNNGALAIMYCFVFLYLVFAGGGPWSADALWRKRA